MKNTKQIVIERTYQADLEDVWALWTTKKGFESWWGPGGFVAKVSKLELRPSGELHYEMTAVGSSQIEFMKKAGMPQTTSAKLTFKEVEPMTRLCYSHTADFIPGVEPYQVVTEVQFHVAEDRLRMTVIMDPMHNEEWTQRAATGMESQIGKLEEIL